MASLWLSTDYFSGVATADVEMAFWETGNTLSYYESAPGTYTGLSTSEYNEARALHPKILLPKPNYADIVTQAGPSSFWPMSDAGTGIVDVAGSVTGTGVGTGNMARQQPSILPSGEGLATDWVTGAAATYFDCGDNFDFAGQTNYTWAGWFMSRDATGRYAAGKGQSVPAERHTPLYAGPNRTIQATRTSLAGGDQLAGSTVQNVFQTNVPFHQVTTYDGIGVTTWVNGVKQLSRTSPNVTLLDNTASFPFRLGAPGHTTASACWYGKMQYVAIWNGRVLTDDEIETLYRAG